MSPKALGSKKTKVKIHFNRVNMSRKDPRVWTASNYKACNQATEIKVIHKGKVLLHTVYDPKAKQPRAYLTGQATIRREDNIVVVEV